MPSLSATIIVLNEEEGLARTLRSLQCVDEIVVVDSGSKDMSCQIALDHGARVIHHDWKGYSEQKNFAASQANHNWILSLDADEELNSELQRSISNWKKLEPKVVGYRFARRAQYLGRWIRYSGWYPDRKLRLYDRRCARWGDWKVHESIIPDGEVGILSGELLHYTCNSFRAHAQRVDRYTTLAAREMFANGLSRTVFGRTLFPMWTFFNTYLLKFGILDGYQGLIISFMASYYVYKKYKKLARLVKGEKFEG